MASTRALRIGFMLSLAIVVLASTAGRAYRERMTATEPAGAYTDEVAVK